MLVTHQGPSPEPLNAMTDNKEPATVKIIKSGKKTLKVFNRAGLIAANPPRWSVVDSISSTASGTVASSSRGLECLQEKGTSSVEIRPVQDKKGSYRFGAGQVGAFSISFDHQ